MKCAAVHLFTARYSLKLILRNICVYNRLIAELGYNYKLFITHVRCSVVCSLSIAYTIGDSITLPKLTIALICTSLLRLPTIETGKPANDVSNYLHLTMVTVMCAYIASSSGCCGEGTGEYILAFMDAYRPKQYTQKN